MWGCLILLHILRCKKYECLKFFFGAKRRKKFGHGDVWCCIFFLRVSTVFRREAPKKFGEFSGFFSARSAEKKFWPVFWGCFLNFWGDTTSLLHPYKGYILKYTGDVNGGLVKQGRCVKMCWSDVHTILL